MRLNFVPRVSQGLAVPSSNGNPGWFYETYPDTLNFNGSVAITTVATTLLLTGAPDQCIYLFYLGAQAATGGEVAPATFSFAYGPSPSTLTNLLPSPQNLPTTQNDITSFWSGAQLSNNVGGMTPAAYPFVLYPGNNLYVVSAGAGTINFYPLVLYAQV